MTKAEQETFNYCTTCWEERIQQHLKQASEFRGLGLAVEARIAEARAESVRECLTELQGGQ